MTTKVSDLELRKVQCENWALYRITQAHGTELFENDFVYAKRTKLYENFFSIIPSLQTELSNEDYWSTGDQLLHEYNLTPATEEELDQYHYIVFLYGRKTSFQRHRRTKNEILRNDQYKIRVKFYVPILKTEENLEEIKSNFFKGNNVPYYVKGIRDLSRWKWLTCVTDKIVFK